MAESNQFNELQKLETALNLLKTAEMKVGDIFDGLTEVIQTTKHDIMKLEEERKKLQNDKRELQRKADKQEKEISGLTKDQLKLLLEYEHIKEELEKFTQVATSVGTISIQDMRATLSIYRILNEEVFASRPHFKILFMLHGDIDTMDLEKLKMALGLGGALVLRACHELANAKLIEFDENTRTVKLIQRFFPKQNRIPQ